MKISVSLTDEAAEVIQSIASRRGISVSEAIRRAIAIERFVVKELEAGSTFLIRRSNGDTDQVQFVFA